MFYGKISWYLTEQGNFCIALLELPLYSSIFAIELYMCLDHTKK